MPNKVRNALVATLIYTLVLKFASWVLPDPRRLAESSAAQVPTWQHQAGFHASWLGAVFVGALLALALPGIRTWLVAKLSQTKLPWPTLVGSLVAVLLVVAVASGMLWQQAFYVRGVLGWVVTPLMVWLGSIVSERFGEQLLTSAQHAKTKTQGQITAIKQAIQQQEQPAVEQVVE